MPPMLSRAELETRARQILLTNRRQGIADWNGQPFDFVVPSLTGYPFQWFWDSCFHAIALTHLDGERAKAELTTLLRGAQPDGFIPHIIFWERDKQADFLSRNIVGMTALYYSATIQPPLIAYAVERVYQATGDTAFRDAALPALTAYYRWLRYHRDPDDDGLIAIIQPEEAGTDCSPKYDAALGLTELSNRGFIAALRQVYAAYEPMRGDDRRILAADIFHFEDALVNAIYAFSLRALARLLGDDPAAVEFQRMADKTRDALLSKCWDEDAGAFFDLQGVAEKPVKMTTISSLMPLILDDLPRPIVERLVGEWLTNPAHFWLPYPIPSVPASNPRFMPGNPRGFIWRGPSWVNTNWFLSHALRRHGYGDVADTIKTRTLQAVAQSGFREYYQPYTGEGLGARDFGWSTLALDL